MLSLGGDNRTVAARQHDIAIRRVMVDCEPSQYEHRISRHVSSDAKTVADIFRGQRHVLMLLCCAEFIVSPSSRAQAVEDCVREISFHPIGKDGHDRAVLS